MSSRWLALAVMLGTSPVWAQPAPAPAPAPSVPPADSAEPPPEYGPPPGYDPAPGAQPYQAQPYQAQPYQAQPYGQPYQGRPYGVPRGYGPYPYRPYQPPPAPFFKDEGIDRDFTIGLGLGFGALSVKDGGQWDGAGGLSYTLRLGFGLTRNLLIAWNVEGTSTSDSRDNWTTLSQTIHLASLMYYPFGRRLFLKGGIGGGYLSRDDGYTFEASEWGLATSGAIGYEILQGWHTAFDIELSATTVRYSNQALGFANGLNFVVAWY